MFVHWTDTFMEVTGGRFGSTRYMKFIEYRQERT